MTSYHLREYSSIKPN